MRMEEYIWGLKSTILSRFEKMIWAVIFEKYQNKSCQLEKNKKGNVFKIWKNRFPKLS